MYITHAHTPSTTTTKHNVDANLGESDNVISGDEPSPGMPTKQSQNPEWPKNRQRQIVKTQVGH